ncbi:hypothetical protein ACWCXB_23305 [Streptomyces sp. NPDC001514]
MTARAMATAFRWRPGHPRGSLPALTVRRVRLLRLRTLNTLAQTVRHYARSTP